MLYSKYSIFVWQLRVIPRLQPKIHVTEAHKATNKHSSNDRPPLVNSPINTNSQGRQQKHTVKCFRGTGSSTEWPSKPAPSSPFLLLLLALARGGEVLSNSIIMVAPSTSFLHLLSDLLHHNVRNEHEYLVRTQKAKHFIWIWKIVRDIEWIAFPKSRILCIFQCPFPLCLNQGAFFPFSLRRGCFARRYCGIRYPWSFAYVLPAPWTPEDCSWLSSGCVLSYLCIISP